MGLLNNFYSRHSQEVVDKSPRSLLLVMVIQFLLTKSHCMSGIVSLSDLICYNNNPMGLDL